MKVKSNQVIHYKNSQMTPKSHNVKIHEAHHGSKIQKSEEGEKKLNENALEPKDGKGLKIDLSV